MEGMTATVEFSSAFERDQVLQTLREAQAIYDSAVENMKKQLRREQKKGGANVAVLVMSIAERQRSAGHFFALANAIGRAS